MNTKKSIEALRLSAEKLARRWFGLADGRIKNPGGMDGVQIAHLLRTVDAVAEDVAPSHTWIRHLHNEVGRLHAALSESELLARPEGDVGKSTSAAALEQAKRRLQKEKYFGRNRAKPVRIRIGIDQRIAKAS